LQIVTRDLEFHGPSTMLSFSRPAFGPGQSRNSHKLRYFFQ
jgi:hypothetical protein